MTTRTTTLAEIARAATVTFDDGEPEVERESGMAVVRHQLHWRELKFVHDPTFDRMVPYGLATDGEWYVDWGKGYEKVDAPVIEVPQ